MSSLALFFPGGGRMSSLALFFLLLESFCQSQLDEPNRIRLHETKDMNLPLVDSTALSKRCRFENKATRLLLSVGGRLDLASFESRWQEIYPEENLCRNPSECLHPEILSLYDLSLN